MNRRGFFKRTVGTVAAALLAPYLPKPVLPPFVVTPEMQQAMSASMAGLFNPSKAVADAYRQPISMRYVKSFEFESDRLPTRFDVLYGFATVHPEFAVRVAG